ncbi:MAG: hypothetical protein MMC33_003424 [Icmadophila ericetorum]|nr:hypothetical protein [Icmadophila ericetorum]
MVRSKVLLPSKAEYESYLTTKNADLQVNSMPKLRDITWRSTDGYGPDFNGLTTSSYKTAATGYQKGEIQANPCSYCVRGRGLFKECVRVRMPNGKFAFGGKCCNCEAYRQACVFRSQTSNFASNPASNPASIPASNIASNSVSNIASNSASSTTHCSCGADDQCIEDRCECFNRGEPCGHRCSCSPNCKNDFNELPELFGERDIRANPCLASLITNDCFAEYSLEDLKELIVRMDDSFYQVQCLQNTQLADWMKRCPGEVGSEAARNAWAMEIIRYGLTTSKALSEPELPKPFFFSFCEKRWVSTLDTAHCDSCDKCHEIGNENCGSK